jgi:glycosyltransferase involved in cell wall biosynthesis
VTISYNQAPFLEEAIKSVLGQGYDALEYIVVDPGSTDGSRDIIEKYREGISSVVFESDDGPADGLNKGFSKATGEVYGYINADDILLPETLKKVNWFFDREKGVDVVSSHCCIIDREGRIIQRSFSHKFNLKQYVIGNCVLIQQSTFFRSELFKKVGGFNPGNLINWDGELAVDFALAGASFKVVQDYWSCYRVYGESITSSSAYKEKLFKDYKRLQTKTGLKVGSKFSKRACWVVNWLGQPGTLIRRISDGFIHPNRII